MHCQLYKVQILSLSILSPPTLHLLPQGLEQHLPKDLGQQNKHKQRPNDVDAQCNHVPFAFLWHPANDQPVRQQRTDDVLPVEAEAGYHIDDRETEGKHRHVLEQQLDVVGETGPKDGRLRNEL